MSGLDEWIEIFRGGRQVDSNGREHDGDALIERAVQTFDSTHHEPPLVIGHPADNSPAFGWVESLKTAARDGASILLAKCRQVVPEFADLVKQGVYKKRSAAFYPDGRLRHVGFLGGMPPAVKGLADIGFTAAADTVFEFSDDYHHVGAASSRDRKEEAMKFSEFMEIFKFWKQVEKDPDLQLPEPPQAPAKPADNAVKTFSEAEVQTQIEAAKKQAELDARRHIEAEFAEKTAAFVAEARKRALTSWCDEKIAAGKIAPAWVKLGLVEFMQRLDAEDEIRFAEDVTSSAVDWMKRFIDELPKLVDFGEIAARDKDVSGDAGAQIEALIAAKRKEHQGLSFSDALTAVQIDHPQLARKYADSLR
jgi:hypothetical protein